MESKNLNPRSASGKSWRNGMGRLGGAPFPSTLLGSGDPSSTMLCTQPAAAYED